MSLALINIGESHDGGLAGRPVDGDAIVCAEGMIAWIGATGEVSAADHEVVIDVAGATVAPGFIDSHVHVTFGDFTPRQDTVGFLSSYVHGGTTTSISASEVHTPGRPRDPAGVKALALAAQRCFEDYRPGGMRVHAGSVILEPGLVEADFAELRAARVWLAKAGFGNFASAMDYVPVVADAKRAGLNVMCHTGGGSIRGSMSKIGADALLAMRPHVAGHANGGPTALTREENERLVAEGDGIAIQLVQAGNLRSAIHLSELLVDAGALDRLIIATDTPTGTGVVPLGMLHVMSELASLGPLDARQAIAAATGSPAAVYGLDAGRLEVGRPADLVVLDAPVGSSGGSAMGALEIGDMPAVACAVTDGVLRFSTSRNTPAPGRPVQVLHNTTPTPLS